MLIFNYVSLLNQTLHHVQFKLLVVIRHTVVTFWAEGGLCVGKRLGNTMFDLILNFLRPLQRSSILHPAHATINDKIILNDDVNSHVLVQGMLHLGVHVHSLVYCSLLSHWQFSLSIPSLQQSAFCNQVLCENATFPAP